MRSLAFVFTLFLSLTTHAADTFDRGPTILEEAKPYLVGISPNFAHPAYGELPHGVCIGVALTKRFVLTHKYCLYDQQAGKPFANVTVQPFPFEEGRRLPAKKLNLDFKASLLGAASGLTVDSTVAIIDLGAEVLPATAPFRTKEDPSLRDIVGNSESCGVAYFAMIESKDKSQPATWGAGFRPFRLKETTAAGVDQDDILSAQFNGYVTGNDLGAPVLCRAKKEDKFRVVGFYRGFQKWQGTLPQPLVVLQDLKTEDGWIREILKGIE